MRSITVIGAGRAGLTFIERLRKKDSNVKLTLIDKNNSYFSRKNLISLPGDTSKRLDLAEWAYGRGVEFIQGTLERISLRRQKIYLKHTEPQGFSTLIVATGLVSRKLPVKGEHREGFFYLSQIDPEKLRGLLRLFPEATVYVSTYLGIKLILALASLGKEVKLVSSNLNFLAEHKEGLIEALKERGVALYLGASVEEAVGEGMIKAVKISPLKVFSSQLVFIDSGFIANRNFFEEDIEIKNTFFSNYKGIYFLGDVNSSNIEKETFFAFNDEEANQQGLVLADYLLEGKTPVFEKKTLNREEKEKIIEDALR